MFAKHSWYFRNALVRANYRNPQKGIQPDKSFLVKFFRNLLLGENNELKNRYMLIGYKEENDADGGITHYPSSTQQVPNKLTNNPNIKAVANAIGKEECSIKQIMEEMHLKDRPSFLSVYLTPAITEGCVCMKYPNSPHHPRQRYLLTVRGLMQLDRE